MHTSFDDEELLRELLSNEKALILYDLDKLKSVLGEIKSVYGNNFIHHFAVKANPIVEFLKVIVEFGFGLECASQEEVLISMATGCKPELILHDGPAKTQLEIDSCLQQGISLVLNDEIELSRVENSEMLSQSNSLIALRINPLVGGGSISKTSVSVTESKFGLPISSENEIIGHYKRCVWLTGLHVHSGSQGMTLEMMVEAVKRMVFLAEKVEHKISRKLQWLDIGGGLAFDYREGFAHPSHSEYSASLRTEIPSLFERTRVCTEFGRSIAASTAIAISKVEKSWHRDGIQHVIGHFGSDLFIRWALNPDDWHHRIEILGGGELQKTQIHGPLCYHGDKLGRIQMLAKAKAESLLLIRDVGAYTLSIWAGHCNRVRPLVLALDRGEIRVLLAAESLDSVVKKWSYSGP